MPAPHEPASAAPYPRADGRVPFRVRIGVTGHRHLDDPEGVAAMVSAALQRIRDDLFPPTEATPVTFTLVSPIAEGADRVVAIAARDLLGEHDFELEVVLPLAVADYEQDFTAPGSVGEFRELLASATSRVQLTRTGTRIGKARDAAYETAGHYVVERSDVLIAVWDGRHADGRGGTAEIVAYGRDAGVPVLVVPVGDAAEVESGDGALNGLDKQPPEAFKRLDEYNRASIAAGGFASAVDRTHEHLETAITGSPIHWMVEPVADWALPYHVRADILALRYQSRFEALAKAIHFLAALAVTAVAGQVVFAPDAPGWLGFEVGFVAALVGALGAGRWLRLHDRWISYRSLAEAFRSGLFIALTDPPGRHEPADPGHVADLDEPWFQRAFTEAWKLRPDVTAAGGDAAELRRFLVEAWIDGQVDYHRGSAARMRKRRHLIGRLIYALAALTIVVAVLHILGVGRGSLASKAFELLAIALPGFGAALTGLREQGQFRLHEQRARRTANRLERLKAAESRSGLAGVRRLAVDTQGVIVAESVDWSGVLEFQDLEMVI